MLHLTPELVYDHNKELGEQSRETTTFITALIDDTAPADVIDEEINATLRRPIREVWNVGDAEVLRLTSYNHPATHPACFATLSVVVLVRPKPQPIA